VKRREPNHWSVKSNPTLARKREPDRRYAISSPTSAEERKVDRRFAYANPTLVQHRQTDADLQPTISTFYDVGATSPSTPTVDFGIIVIIMLNIN
jgi:hypothetical protein